MAWSWHWHILWNQFKLVFYHCCELVGDRLMCLHTHAMFSEFDFVTPGLSVNCGVCLEFLHQSMITFADCLHFCMTFANIVEHTNISHRTKRVYFCCLHSQNFSLTSKNLCPWFINWCFEITSILIHVLLISYANCEYHVTFQFLQASCRCGSTFYQLLLRIQL